ncbi:phosphate acyltransferase PlsX, partial [bacterium]|nr:phosphate acyltransferase PlsX [bacterium]
MSRAATEPPVVAVDAMGGDIGPPALVPGALDALREGGFRLALYGDRDAIEREIAGLAAVPSSYEIVHCAQIIEMAESPAQAVRAKPDSPVVRAMRDQKEGRVQAVFSAGSTGAMVAGSLMLLGRIEGVDRPAIATVIPTYDGRFLLLDAGANVQCTPQHLVTFAVMGDVYARELLEVARPRLGLLNIGEEPGKGSELTVAAHALLAASDLNFVGNVEGRQLLFGEADVVVTDGFTGNMVLKLVEGFGAFLLKAYRDSAPAAANGVGSAGLGDLLNRLDYASTG